MITFTEVSLGKGPASPCAKCATRAIAPSMRDAGEVLLELAEVAAAWGAKPGPNVAFAGVEPFSHPKLPDMVYGAVERGFERIRLDTDGGALGLHGNAAGVVSAGVRQICISLLAAGPAHDALSGRPGLFEAAVVGVAAFRSAAKAAGTAVCVTGRVPVCRHNAAHVVQAVSAFSALGAVAVELELLGTDLDADVVKAAEQAAVVQGIWLHVPGHSLFPAPVDRVEAVR